MMRQCFSNSGLLGAFSLTAVGLTSWLYLRYAQRNTRTRTLEHEVVVIIGASSGVGLEAAKLYARDSSPSKISVHLVARSAAIEETANDLAKETITGKKIGYSRADAGSSTDMQKLEQKLKQEYGHIDTLIFCAGALTVSSIEKLSRGKVTAAQGSGKDSQREQKDHSRIMQVASDSYQANVLSCMDTVTTLLPLLRQSSRPRVAVLSSVAAEIPAPTRAIYAANKAALSMFLRCLRIEWEHIPIGSQVEKQNKGIGITIVYPASIATGLRAKALDADAEADAPQFHEKGAMTAAFVAEQVRKAIDCEVDELWLPGYYWWVAKFGTILFPGFITNRAKKKYKWPGTE